MQFHTDNKTEVFLLPTKRGKQCLHWYLKTVCHCKVPYLSPDKKLKSDSVHSTTPKSLAVLFPAASRRQQQQRKRPQRLLASLQDHKSTCTGSTATAQRRSRAQILLTHKSREQSLRAGCTCQRTDKRLGHWSYLSQSLQVRLWAQQVPDHRKGSCGTQCQLRWIPAQVTKAGPRIGLGGERLLGAT